MNQAVWRVGHEVCMLGLVAEACALRDVANRWGQPGYDAAAAQAILDKLRQAGDITAAQGQTWRARLPDSADGPPTEAVDAKKFLDDNVQRGQLPHHLRVRVLVAGA